MSAHKNAVIVRSIDLSNRMLQSQKHLCNHMGTIKEILTKALVERKAGNLPEQTAVPTPLYVEDTKIDVRENTAIPIALNKQAERNLARAYDMTNEAATDYSNLITLVQILMRLTP